MGGCDKLTNVGDRRCKHFFKIVISQNSRDIRRKTGVGNDDDEDDFDDEEFRGSFKQ